MNIGKLLNRLIYIEITWKFCGKEARYIQIYKEEYKWNKYKQNTKININKVICCNFSKQFYKFSDFYIIL